MFQQFLDVEPKGARLYGVLYPTGRMDEPWDVRCISCPYTAMAPNHTAAVRAALLHDRHHDSVNERQD